MAYLPRYTVVHDGCSFHLTWRCHNKDWLLRWDWAKELYYNLLLKYKDRYHVQIHSYQFMENHLHLTGTMQSKESFSNFFRVVNNLFARNINKRLNRCGQVVMDRFKSPRIQNDEYMLRSMTYGDLNGVRAGRDKLPEESRWSSYAYYAYGKENPLITPAPSYLALGNTPQERQKAYRDMVAALVLSDRINISNVCFIGDPDWVERRYEELKNQMVLIYARRRVQREECFTSPSTG